MLSSCTLQAQFDTLIPWEFYFEDSRGNRDTTVLSLAPDVGFINDTVHPLDGSNLGPFRFDSVLEARIARYNDYAFCWGSSGRCFLRESTVAESFLDRQGRTVGFSDVLLTVYSRYPPVTISWGRSPFQNDSLVALINGSVLVNSFPVSQPTYETGAPTPGMLDYACLGSDSAKTFGQIDFPWGDFPPGSLSTEGLDVTVLGTDSLHRANSFYLDILGAPAAPCDFLEPVSNRNRPVTSLKFYPNPAHQNLNFELPADYSTRPVRVEVFSATGRLASSRPHVGLSGRLDVRELVSGWYFLRLVLEDGTTVTRKFVISR